MKKKAKFHYVVSIVPLIPMLIGCEHPSHLVFHQNTVLGVDVATSAEGGTVHATVAYDRQTTAFVPKTKIKVVDADGKRTEVNEAMSVISKSEMDLNFLSINEIHEVFATGDAAINLARRPEAIRALGEAGSKTSGSTNQ